MLGKVRIEPFTKKSSLRYTIEEKFDGSTFVCIRTTAHEKCPVKPGVGRTPGQFSHL